MNISNIYTAHALHERCHSVYCNIWPNSQLRPWEAVLTALTASSKAQEQQLCLGTAGNANPNTWGINLSRFLSNRALVFLFQSISLDPQPRSQKLKRCHHKDWELSRSVSHGTVMTRLSKVLCRVCQDIQPICSELYNSIHFYLQNRQYI